MSFDLIGRKFGAPPPDEPEPEPGCLHCEDCGWEAYSMGYGDPHFRECPHCHNPNDHPSP